MAGPSTVSPRACCDSRNAIPWRRLSSVAGRNCRKSGFAVTLNVTMNPLFRQLRPASEDNRRQGIAFLESQQARGGTVLGPAITTAYQYRDPDRPLNVVILSDGLTEQRDRAELLSLIRSRPSNARVFCI